MSERQTKAAAAKLLRRLSGEGPLTAIGSHITDMDSRQIGDLLVFAADSLDPPLDGSVEEATLYVDGAAIGNPGPAGAGGVIIDRHNKKIAEICQPLGVTTNNVAEYRALVIGLRAARDLGVRRIHVRADSELMVRQMSGRYRIKDEKLQALSREAKDIIDSFDFFDILHVDRGNNRDADRLSKRAADASK